MLADGLEVSAEAREAFIPAAYPGIGPLSKESKYRESKYHRVAPLFRFGPRRANDMLMAASGALQEDGADVDALQIEDATGSARLRDAEAPKALRQDLTSISRRSAMSGLVAAGLPGAVYAMGNPLTGGEFSGYKARSYGDQPVSTAPVPSAQCPEGQRSTPDGRGGRKCVDRVKSPLGAIGDKMSAARDDQQQGEAGELAAPVAVKSREPSTASSSAPLTLEQLVANSVAQKESVLGRKLSESEIADLQAKVKTLLQ